MERESECGRKMKKVLLSSKTLEVQRLTLFGPTQNVRSFLNSGYQARQTIPLKATKTWTVKGHVHHRWPDPPSHPSHAAHVLLAQPTEVASDLNVRTRHQGYPTRIVERSGSDPPLLGEEFNFLLF